MKTMGIQGFTKKRRVRTTVADAGRGVFPDLVCRQFHAPAPNRVLVGDITYLPVSGGGNMYLATVIDCYSRRLVGFSIADHMRVDLVIDALDSAQRARGSLKGAIFHSDHGSVYTSKAFSSRCTMLGGDPIDGSGGNQRRQRASGVVQRDIETRGAAKPEMLRLTAARQTGRLRVVCALQPEAQTLMVRLSVAPRVRKPHLR